LTGKSEMVPLPQIHLSRSVRLTCWPRLEYTTEDPTTPFRCSIAS
jgi:hypothetical protein